MFKLDKRLEKDSVILGEFPLSLLLMSRDANYPWFILVPQRKGLTELYQLEDKELAQLVRESRHLSMVLMDHFAGDKLNVAALGNVVPQLHIHHVVRYRDDPAWPAPIWGAVGVREFEGETLSLRAVTVQARLAEGFKPASLA